MIMSSKITNENKKSCFSVYHQALKDMIEKVFVGDVVYEPVDTAFDYAIKQTKGDLKFPFISILKLSFSHLIDILNFLIIQSSFLFVLSFFVGNPLKA